MSNEAMNAVSPSTFQETSCYSLSRGIAPATEALYKPGSLEGTITARAEMVCTHFLVQPGATQTQYAL